MKRDLAVLMGLFFALFLFNYSFFDSLLIEAFSDYEEVDVLRVVDGDTILVHNKTDELKVRLLGINSPEKGEIGSGEATNFLKEKIENKSVILYFEGDRTDRYARILAYVFLEGENINLESVREGFSNYYFPSGVSSYQRDFVFAWEECLKNNKNLCESSSNSCIEIYSVDFDLQTLVLKNNCGFSVSLDGWSLKDEGRKRIVFEHVFIGGGDFFKVENNDYDYIWTESGDSAFLRDNEELLVDFVDFRE